VSDVLEHTTQIRGSLMRESRHNEPDAIMRCLDVARPGRSTWRNDIIDDPSSTPANREQTNEEISAFLARYPAAIREMSEHLRRVMKQAMPEARETLYAGQNHIGYGFGSGMRARICYICPMRDYVRLGFMYGAVLPDPDGLLLGEGKRLRHIKVRSMADARNASIVALIEAANAYSHDSPTR
jgi:hypothetical protein